MSLDFKRIQSRLSPRRSVWTLVLLLAIPFSIPIAGCGPSEPKEISAATSGYLPAKETTAKSNSVDTKSAVVNSERPASPGSPGVQNSSDKLPTAPAIPAFQPGKLDPKIASKTYMKLQLGDLNGAQPLMQFLDTSSRAVRELLADGRQKLLTRDVLLERGMELSRMKLEASQRLEKLAANEDEKAVASVGKLEAYSQMASFGDVAASDNLRELASAEMKNADKRVSQQAKSISLSLLVNDYESGTAKIEELLALANTVLLDGKDLTATNLNALMQAIEAMSKHKADDAALQLAQKVEEAFRENAEPQIALSAWELHASRLKETNEIGALLQSDSKEDQDPVRVRAAVDAIMAKIPSPWTAFFLVQIAIKVEYSGRPYIAKELIEVAETQIKNLKDPDAQAELERNCKQFRSRFEILNKPLNLSELVDTAGKPVDLERYKGKVVLVDFWATWCGPCLQEIPNIEEAFAAYNKGGFEVIGVNLDEDRSTLDKFLASKKLLWSTYVSSKRDAVGFETPLAKEIGISAIPFIAIIGKDGNVAGIHIRGRKIQDKIVELLAKE